MAKLSQIISCFFGFHDLRYFGPRKAECRKCGKEKQG